MPLKPEECCKERVPSQDGWRYHQCSRRAVRDGYCRQHHPDSVKARIALAEANYKLESAKRNWPHLMQKFINSLAAGEVNDPVRGAKALLGDQEELLQRISEEIHKAKGTHHD